MDITLLFKACVKTIRVTNKSLNESNNITTTVTDKTSILKSSRNYDTNLKTPKDVLKQLTNLRKLLLDNKSAYLNVISYLSTKKSMSEMDREELDKTAQEVIMVCSNQMKDYKRNIQKNERNKQRLEHYLYVIESVESYLREVSKIYAETKAVRIKKVVDTHKLSKLEGKQQQQQQQQTTSVIDYSNTSGKSDIEEDLSTEEMQMFQLENDGLYKELNSLADEVKQMESKVVHISELQKTFTEQVLQQEKDIERIATTVATATDDVKDANNQIRQAIKRNAGLRVWVLFFLLVMSFSLLFLDWYND